MSPATSLLRALLETPDDSLSWGVESPSLRVRTPAPILLYLLHQAGIDPVDHTLDVAVGAQSDFQRQLLDALDIDRHAQRAGSGPQHPSRANVQLLAVT